MTLDKNTWGNSRSAINLVTILLKPEYQECARRARRVLTKQFEALQSVMDIRCKNIREHSLYMWHERFPSLLSGLPEIVRTHILCVETGKYRQLLRLSKGGERWISRRGLLSTRIQ